MKKKPKQRKTVFEQRPKITFFCSAYNCEKYVEATIRSVLNQTEKKIQLVICNNGSTDNTGIICEKYSKKDKRIIYFSNKVNKVTDTGIQWGKRDFWPRFTGEYVSSIDADDLLSPDYAEKMYQIAKKNQADIAVCGTVMFDDRSGRATGQRLPPHLIISEMENLNPYFEALYGQFRPIWAKIFRTEFFDRHFEYAWEGPNWLTNGSDTYVSLGYLEKCECLVAINENLHYYRVRENSTFNTQIVDPIRIRAGQLLYERGLKCIEALGINNQKNINVLVAVYFGHMEDLLRLLDNSLKISIRNKLDFLISIINNPLMQKFCEQEDLSWQLFRRLSKSTEAMDSSEEFFYLEMISNFWGRLYLAWHSREEENHDLLFTVLLSALCDPKNDAQYGIFLLHEKWNIKKNPFKKFITLSKEQQQNLLKNPTALCSNLNQTEDVLQLNKKKKDALDFLDHKNYQAAMLLLNEILETYPLDREALYFKIYLLYQLNDLGQTALYAQMARVFWPEDEDLQEICNATLKEIDYIIRGYENDQ